MESGRYSALAPLYDHWVRQVDYRRLLRFVVSRLPKDRKPVVIDACCGTGTLAIMLAEEGCSVLAMDVAAEMLRAAKVKAEKSGVSHIVQFAQLDVLRDGWPISEVDAVICTLDSINYFRTSELRKFLRKSFSTVRAKGRVIFDFNTSHKLVNVFGNTVYRESTEEYSYVWRNKLGKDLSYIDFDIDVCLPARPPFPSRRFGERHRQYVFPSESVAKLVIDTGFHGCECLDDYSETKVSDVTLRATIVAEK